MKLTMHQMCRLAGAVMEDLSEEEMYDLCDRFGITTTEYHDTVVYFLDEGAKANWNSSKEGE